MGTEWCSKNIMTHTEFDLPSRNNTCLPKIIREQRVLTEDIPLPLHWSYWTLHFSHINADLPTLYYIKGITFLPLSYYRISLNVKIPLQQLRHGMQLILIENLIELLVSYLDLRQERQLLHVQPLAMLAYHSAIPIPPDPPQLASVDCGGDGVRARRAVN